MADMKITNQALPQGQPNGLAEIKKQLTDVTDEIAVSETLTGYMTPNPYLFKAAGECGTFSVPTITTSGLGNYDKAKGSPIGAVATSFQDYKCRYDRARSFILDKIDVMTNDGLIQASPVLAEFMRSEVVPEIDATRIATCAAAAIEAKNTASKAPAKTTFLSDIIAGINKARQGLHLKTTEGMKVHVSDAYQDVLEQSSEYTRSKDIAGGIRRLDTGVDMINRAEVIYTPASYMKTAFTYNNAITSNAPSTSADVPDGGFTPDTNALDVAALIVAPGVANGLVASETAQIFGEGQVPGVIGSWIDYRIYHDCFILKNRVAGLYALTVPKGSTG